nr:NAD(P)/FAD-dependent oxidoreductase [Pedobacter sp. ASV19]
MQANNNIIIAGGGLAGLTCALHLRKAGFEVTVIEKNTYPQHKVCGEYISNEVLPYLQWLDADPGILQPKEITRLQISTVKGSQIECHLPLGGFGLSRAAFDHFLYSKALEKGCKILNEKILDIAYSSQGFSLKTDTATRQTPLLIGAFGKRSSLDKKLHRHFIDQKSPWLAVKAHYRGEFDDNLVALHNFRGGYCGVSKVETNLINICYLTAYDQFKKYQNMEDFQQQVLFRNKHLKHLFEHTELAFESPLSIAQICFEKKELVKDHILMIGDAAGLIHPLCGNGMGMAIHSAKICAELIIEQYGISDQLQLERNYSKQWKANFEQRMAFGKRLSSLLLNGALSDIAMSMLVRFPSILPQMIKRTHGQPLTILPSHD